METKPGNLERRTRKALWQKAAKDPLLLKDIGDVESAFRTADAETIRGLDLEHLELD